MMSVGRQGRYLAVFLHKTTRQTRSLESSTASRVHREAGDPHTRLSARLRRPESNPGRGTRDAAGAGTPRPSRRQTAARRRWVPAAARRRVSAVAAGSCVAGPGPDPGPAPPAGVSEGGPDPGPAPSAGVCGGGPDPGEGGLQAAQRRRRAALCIFFLLMEEEKKKSRMFFFFLGRDYVEVGWAKLGGFGL